LPHKIERKKNPFHLFTFVLQQETTGIIASHTERKIKTVYNPASVINNSQTLEIMQIVVKKKLTRIDFVHNLQQGCATLQEEHKPFADTKMFCVSLLPPALTNGFT
jgi:hypothetical protein